MKLYDRQDTPNAARIRIVLAEKQLEHEVEFITVDLIAAEQKSPAFLQMNPIGKTPVLVLNHDTVLSECTAITEYLDHLDGRPRLTGTTPLQKGLIHMMQRRVEMILLDPVDDYFHYATFGLGPALRPWRMPDWTGAREWAERRGRQAVENFAYFDQWLSTRPFLAGDQLSMADITLYATRAFAAGARLEIPPNLPALDRWHERVAALPSVKNRTGQTFLPEDITRRHAAHVSG